MKPRAKSKEFPEFDMARTVTGFFLQFLGFSISLKTGLYELGNSKSITKIKSNNKLDKCAHILSLGTVGSGGCDKIFATFSLLDKIC